MFSGVDHFDRLNKVSFILGLRLFKIPILTEVKPIYNVRAICNCKLELAIKLLLNVLIKPAWMFTLCQDDFWHFFLLLWFHDRQELGHVDVFNVRYGWVQGLDLKHSHVANDDTIPRYVRLAGI